MHITEAAEAHFRSLLAQENNPALNLRVLVTQGGTPQADIILNFCAPNEAQDTDTVMAFKDFNLFVDQAC